MKKSLLFMLMFIMILGFACKEKEPDNTVVTKVNVTSSDEITSIEVSKTLQLNVEVLPSTATNKNVEWTSSDTLIATVENGIVTACSVGEVTITATSKSSPTISGSIQLTICEKGIKDNYDEFAITTDVVEGYTVSDGVYTFTKSGEYTISGLLIGQLLFDSTLDSKLTLNLNNVYIENANGSAIYWQSEDSKIEINVCENTINYLIEGQYESEESSGAINSENNIEICGEGILNVESQHKHAIKGSEITIKDDVILNLSAASDGVHGKAIIFEGATTNITNCSDGIEAELNSKGNKGTVVITGGTINISNCNCAIKAEASISIDGEGVVVTITNVQSPTISYPENGYTLENGKVTIDGVDYK